MSKKRKTTKRNQSASYSGKRLSPPRTRTSYTDYSSYYRKGTLSRKPTSKYSSDFWRSRYGSYQPNKDVSEKYMLKKCLYDVARIANIYDPDVRLAYMEHSKKYNEMQDRTIYLDPRLAVDENLELGNKIDVYTGEILLGTALRNSHIEDPNLNYVKHLANIKQGESLLDKAKSALYLSMEMNAAYHEVKQKTPGFKSYCYSRVDHLLESKPSDSLEKAFSEPEISGEAKVSALVREIETFNSSPLSNYGEFSEVIEQVMEQVENLHSSEERLKFAEEIVERYLKGCGEDKQDNEEDKQDNGEKGESEGGKLIEENFRSDHTMGWEADDPSSRILRISGVLNEDEAEGTDPKKPHEILIDRVFEGAVGEIKTKWCNPATYSDDPIVTTYEKASQETRAISEQIKEKLDFIDTDQKAWEERSLRSGELDEGGLDKFAYNSNRVFYQREVFSLPSIQLGILVDESGSMNAYNREKNKRIESAIKMTVALVNAITEIKGIDLHVYGHTGTQVCNMFEYVNPSMDKESFNILSHMKARDANYDSFAIKAAGESMLGYSQKEYYRKLLFVISDGAPSGYNYGGQEASTHMRSISSWLREDHGLEVYGIGIDDAFSQKEGDEMYGENRSIVLPDFDVAKVSNIISTFLENIARG